MAPGPHPSGGGCRGTSERMNCFRSSFAGRGLEPGLQRLRTLGCFPVRGPRPSSQSQPTDLQMLVSPTPSPSPAAAAVVEFSRCPCPLVRWTQTEDGTGRIAVLHAWLLIQAYCVHTIEETLMLMSLATSTRKLTVPQLLFAHLSRVAHLPSAPSVLGCGEWSQAQLPVFSVPWIRGDGHHSNAAINRSW